MKTTILAAIGTLAIAGCTLQDSSQTATPGQTTKSYDLASFNALDVATGIEVEFTTGNAQSVVIENDNGAWDKIIAEVKDDTLHLKRVNKSAFGFNANKEKFFVTVSAPVISSVDTSSGSRVTGTGLSGDDVEVDTSSGSSVKITDISAGNLIIDISSGSSVTLTGTCTSVITDASSGSSLRANGLVCDAAKIDASSGSSTSLTATSSVVADASSGSSVTVAGDPESKSISKSSGASVKIKS